MEQENNENFENLWKNNFGEIPEEILSKSESINNISEKLEMMDLASQIKCFIDDEWSDVKYS